MRIRVRKSLVLLSCVFLSVFALAWPHSFANAESDNSKSTKPKEANSPEALEELAETHIVVTHPKIPKPWTLRLIGAQRADVDVHLQSIGEPVNGFKAYLVRVKDRKVIRTGISDRFGVIGFYRVDRGRYSIVLRKTREQKRDSTVEIGDVVLRLNES